MLGSARWRREQQFWRRMGRKLKTCKNPEQLRTNLRLFKVILDTHDTVRLTNRSQYFHYGAFAIKQLL